MVLLLIILCTIGLAWVLVGYLNYRNLIQLVDFWQETVETLEEQERETEDTYERAMIFNHRENLMHEYQPLEDIRQSIYQEDEKAAKKERRNLLVSCLVLGLFYNFR